MFNLTDDAPDDLFDAYSVYSLTDGMIGVDEAYTDEAEAYAAYDDIVAEQTAIRDEYRAAGQEWAETTVHLYFAPWGNMLAETTIEKA